MKSLSVACVVAGWGAGVVAAAGAVEEEAAAG